MLLSAFTLGLQRDALAVDYGTWINVWNCSARSGYADTDIYGMQVPRTDLSGGWGAPDWNNATWRQWVYADLVNAGITVVIANNTDGGYLLQNGTPPPSGTPDYPDTSGYIAGTQTVFSEIAATPLKLCIALGSTGLQSSTTVDTVWNDFAQGSQYYTCNGKPVLVCYVGTSAWDSTYNPNAPAFTGALANLNNFYRVWASGDTSRPDKWGWQLVPQDGGIPSANQTYSTSAVKQAGINNGVTYWRRSMAFLDYTFWQARQLNPRVMVVGSYDDPGERNAWMSMNTVYATNIVNGVANPKLTPVSGIKMYNPWTGVDDSNVNPTLLRNRAEQWIKDSPLTVISGGNLRDGFYRIRNVATGLYLQDNTDYTQNAILGAAATTSTYDKFALYHLGNNQYRIENINEGRPLSAGDSSLHLTWGDYTTATYGEFYLHPAGTGGQFFIDAVSGQRIAMTNSQTWTNGSGTGTDVQWIMEPLYYFNTDTAVNSTFANGNGSFEYNATGGSLSGDYQTPGLWQTGITGLGAHEVQLVQARDNTVVPDGHYALVIGQSANPTQHPFGGGILKTSYTVAAGDTFNLSFEWATFAGWTAGVDSMQFFLFTSSDDTLSGVLTTVLSGTVTDVPGSTFILKSYTSSSVPTASVGKKVWIQFTPTSADGFARVDSVNLSANP